MGSYLDARPNNPFTTQATHWPVPNSDYQAGDLYWSLGASLRITRFEPAGDGARIARFDDGSHTVLADQDVAMHTPEHAPPATHQRWAAARPTRLSLLANGAEYAERHGDHETAERLYDAACEISDRPSCD